MSTMTLELKRDDECLWLHVSNGKQHGMFNLGKGLRDGGNETLAVQLLREYIDAHLAKFTPDWAGNRQGVEDGKAEALAQPAQAVDVGAIKTLLELVEDEHGGDHSEADCRHCVAVNKLTRAIGNAQAEGWRDIATAPKDGRELILLLTPSRWPQVAYSNTWWTAGFSVECKPTHWMPIRALPAPPTQDTPNAHE